jgi:hypothetical protein
MEEQDVIQLETETVHGVQESSGPAPGLSSARGQRQQGDEEQRLLAPL